MCKEWQGVQGGAHSQLTSLSLGSGGVRQGLGDIQCMYVCTSHRQFEQLTLAKKYPKKFLVHTNICQVNIIQPICCHVSDILHGQAWQAGWITIVWYWTLDKTLGWNWKVLLW